LSCSARSHVSWGETQAVPDYSRMTARPHVPRRSRPLCLLLDATGRHGGLLLRTSDLVLFCEGSGLSCRRALGVAQRTEVPAPRPWVTGPGDSCCRVVESRSLRRGDSSFVRMTERATESQPFRQPLFREAIGQRPGPHGIARDYFSANCSRASMALGQPPSNSSTHSAGTESSTSSLVEPFSGVKV